MCNIEKQYGAPEKANFILLGDVPGGTFMAFVRPWRDNFGYDNNDHNKKAQMEARLGDYVAINKHLILITSIQEG